MAIDKNQMIFTAKQVAEMAGVSVQAIYKAWHAGKFPTSAKFDKTYMLRRADVFAYLEARKTREVE